MLQLDTGQPPDTGINPEHPVKWFLLRNYVTASFLLRHMPEDVENGHNITQQTFKVTTRGHNPERNPDSPARFHPTPSFKLCIDFRARGSHLESRRLDASMRAAFVMVTYVSGFDAP